MSDTDGSLLNTTLIINTKLGTAAFRRKLHKVGLKTFAQAFDADDSTIDDLLSLDEAEELDRLRESYERDPKRFLAKMMRSVETRQQTRQHTRQKMRSSSPQVKTDVREPRVMRRMAADDSWRFAQRGARSYPLPDDELGRTLSTHEGVAKKALDGIADRDNDYLVFEAFDSMALEIDGIRKSMKELFGRYGRNPVYLESLIRANVPNLYLTYIADGAREKFDGKNLWGNLFEALGIDDSNQVKRFKALFMDCLERRHMPTYAQEEKDFYYLYTALLHGGLSKGAWNVLWGTTLLPLARRAAEDPYGMYAHLDGAELLLMIREGEGLASGTKESVKNILSKIPDRTIAPIMESALGVARRLADTGGKGVTMITSSGLPPAAIESLDAITQMPVTGLVPKHHLAAKERVRRIIPIQEGDLYLDVRRGAVLMRWKDQKLPEDYVGFKVEIYVDGRLEKTNEVLRGVGTGILRSCEIEVRPSASYAVGIRLLKPNHEGKETTFDEVGTLNQSFERVHAGCFEFLENTEGTFRLRRRKDRIRRTRTVAFVVKEGRTIRPGFGMTAVENRQTAGAWEGRAIQLFRVEPGASAAVVSESDGSVIFAWHESFGTTIHRDSVIGFTDDGLDLYGVVPGEAGQNTALPNIIIESADEQVAYGDLVATCWCDGSESEIRLSSFEQPNNEALVAEGVCVRLGGLPNFPTLVKKCVVDVRQRSTGSLVCRYRFSVVPIHKFALSHLRLDSLGSSQLVATYSFKVLEQVMVAEESEGSAVSENAAYRVSENATYYLNRPLSHDSARLTIESCDHTRRVTFDLGLAGIEVHLPKELSDISSREPISAAHAMDSMLDDQVIVRTIGNRSNRGVFLVYGDLPLLLGEESRRSEHRFGLFSDPSVFAFNERRKNNDFSLRLTVSFGMRDDWVVGIQEGCGVDLLRFKRGLGLTESWVDVDCSGRATVCFDRPAIIDMLAVFYTDFSRSGRYRSGRTKRHTVSCEMSVGVDRVEVSPEVLLDVKANRKVTVKLLPMDDFGEPDESYKMELSVREGRE